MWSQLSYWRLRRRSLWRLWSWGTKCEQFSWILKSGKKAPIQASHPRKCLFPMSIICNKLLIWFGLYWILVLSTNWWSFVGCWSIWTRLGLIIKFSLQREIVLFIGHHSLFGMFLGLPKKSTNLVGSLLLANSYPTPFVCFIWLFEWILIRPPQQQQLWGRGDCGLLL